MSDLQIWNEFYLGTEMNHLIRFEIPIFAYSIYSPRRLRSPPACLPTSTSYMVLPHTSGSGIHILFIIIFVSKNKAVMGVRPNREKGFSQQTTKFTRKREISHHLHIHTQHQENRIGNPKCGFLSDKSFSVVKWVGKSFLSVVSAETYRLRRQMSKRAAAHKYSESR